MDETKDERKRRKSREASARWKAKNVDRQKAYAKARRDASLDERRRIDREAKTKWREENRELHRARSNAYAAENRAAETARSAAWRPGSAPDIAAYISPIRPNTGYSVQH